MYVILFNAILEKKMPTDRYPFLKFEAYALKKLSACHCCVLLTFYQTITNAGVWCGDHNYNKSLYLSLLISDSLDTDRKLVCTICNKGPQRKSNAAAIWR